LSEVDKNPKLRQSSSSGWLEGFGFVDNLALFGDVHL
jgi:hypothetical protein